jgi:hypothetical protein
MNLRHRLARLEQAARQQQQTRQREAYRPRDATEEEKTRYDRIEALTQDALRHPERTDPELDELLRASGVCRASWMGFVDDVKKYGLGHEQQATADEAGENRC